MLLLPVIIIIPHPLLPWHWSIIRGRVRGPLWLLCCCCWRHVVHVIGSRVKREELIQPDMYIPSSDEECSDDGEPTTMQGGRHNKSVCWCSRYVDDKVRSGER